MDIQSPEHLERLRDRPEIKAALLREGTAPGAAEARFERAARNTLYRQAIETLSARFLASGRSEEIREPIELYGRSCRLLATRLADSPGASYAIAVVAADGAPVDDLLALLTQVSHDYWQGSYFFK